MTTLRIRTSSIAFLLIALSWLAAPACGDDPQLIISGPTGFDSGVEGTFHVTLDHDLSGWDPSLDCYFDNVLVNIPIVGEGFVVSNVQISNLQMSHRDEAGMFLDDDNRQPVVFWRRDFFDDSHNRIKDSVISGGIFSFDVHFKDGVTEGSYTIGHQDISSGSGATCYDGETPVIAADFVYYDNWGGRTFSLVEGDFSGDLKVDQTDLTLLLSNWGVDGEPPEGWDAAAWDPPVEQGELTALLSNWGAGVGAAAAVPEPSTVILLGVGLVGLIGFARRRRD